MKEKLDKAYLGITFGILFPIIGFFIYYLINYSTYSLSGYINVTQKYIEHKQEVYTFCLLMNGLLFYFSYFQFKMDEFSKGLVATTLILAAYLVYLIM